MKKLILAVMISLPLVGCSNWNRVTPSSFDNVATTAEVKKNLVADSLTGIDVDSSGGVVTLTGHLPTRSARRAAIHDASKVPGVRKVINRIEVP